MADVLTLGGTVMAMVSVHFVTLLQARGVGLASAVAYCALIGPSQVGARIVEMAGKGRHNPLWTLTAAMLCVAAGLASLAVGSLWSGWALVLYGAGNGISSIAWGTVPLALFGPGPGPGPGRYATLMGRLARPGLVAQAFSPSLGALVLTSWGPMRPTCSSRDWPSPTSAWPWRSGVYGSWDRAWPSLRRRSDRRTVVDCLGHFYIPLLFLRTDCWFAEIRARHEGAAGRMRNWLKTALFVSALSPSLISVALARIWDNRGLTWDALWYALPGFAGILVVRYIVDALRWNGETFPIILKKVEANDTLMLGIVATYFVPFIGKAIDITVGAVLAMLALGALVLWMMSAIPANPVMRVLGYRFYKAEAANGVVYTLITQRDLLDPKQVRTVKRISGSMLLEIV